jgi:excisionase family DNA binding protein
MIDPIAIAAAAQILGISASRVRAMAVKGQLGALKIGGRWVVERAAVEARRRNGAVSGRPFVPHNAWALLLLASGKDVEGIDPSVRSRLRRALAVDGLVELAPRLAKRSENRLFSAHPGEVAHSSETQRW